MLFSKERPLKKIRNNFLIFFFYCVFIFIGCSQAPSLSIKRRVVSLSPNTSEVISVFFPDVYLVGRTGDCNYPKAIERVDTVCKIKPNVEYLYRLKPDKIFLEEQLFQRREIEELKKISSVFSFCSNDLSSYIKSLKSIQAEFGDSEPLKQYIKELEKPLCGKSNKRFVVLLDGGPRSNYFIAGEQSFLSDILKKLGYSYVGPKGKKFESIDIEHLLKYPFDIILTGSSSHFIERDSRLKRYKLLKISDDILFRAGSRVDKLMVLIQKNVIALFPNELF